MLNTNSTTRNKPSIPAVHANSHGSESPNKLVNDMLVSHTDCRMRCASNFQSFVTTDNYDDTTTLREVNAMDWYPVTRLLSVMPRPNVVDRLMEKNNENRTTTLIKLRSL